MYHSIWCTVVVGEQGYVYEIFNDILYIYNIPDLKCCNTAHNCSLFNTLFNTLWSLSHFWLWVYKIVDTACVYVYAKEATLLLL